MLSSYGPTLDLAKHDITATAHDHYKLLELEPEYIFDFFLTLL